MATKKMRADGTIEEVPGTAADGGLVRAYSLADTREHAYTSVVTLESGARVFIFEHRNSKVKEFQARVKEVAARGTVADAMKDDDDKKDAANEAVLDDFLHIYDEINACIRGWDFEGEPRVVDYQAEKEDLPRSVLVELGEQILTKHQIGKDQSQLSRRR